MTRPSSHSHLLTNLSTHDISILTGVLRSTPTNLTTSFHIDLTKLTDALPESLHRPKGLIPRILTHLTSRSTDRAVLYRVHKPFHPHLIHHLFMEVCNECTTHISRLYEHPDLPYSIRLFRDRMKGIHAHCMEMEMEMEMKSSNGNCNFYPLFPTRKCKCKCVGTTLTSTPARVESGCEACILSFIGGNKDILTDLRASMLGRKKKGRGVPILLTVVEAWIHWLDINEEVQVLEDSREMGKQLRGVRREMQKVRRRERRDLNHRDCALWREMEKPYDIDPMIQKEKEKEFDDEDEDEDAEDDYDMENSIIDDYMQRFSKWEVKPREKDVHPAFRNSALWDDEWPSGTFLRPGKEKGSERSGSGLEEYLVRERRLPGSAYSASVYEDDQVSMSIGAWMDADSGEVSKSYHEFPPTRET